MNSISYSRIKKMSPQLLVTDIKRSVEFYVKKLGFEVDFRYDDFYVGIIKDGWSIHLKMGKPSIEVNKSKRANEDLDIIFSVNEIERLYEELSNKSVEFVLSLRDMPYGKEFYVADPDGNILAFLEEG